MSFPKSLLSVALLVSFSAINFGQETSIDLRKDGRILTGERKNFLLLQIKLNAYKVSPDLRSKFGGTVVSAIVLPPGKTGNSYVIGVVPGDGTLPDDWVVNEDEFNLLRSLAVNRKLAKVESADRLIRRSLALGTKAVAAAKAEELKTLMDEKDSEATVAQSYAGYLFQDLEKINDLPVLSDAVVSYRKSQIESIRPAIIMAIEKSKPGWATPLIISASDDLVDTADLASSSVVERYVKPGSTTGFLTVWSGRSLIIVPEKPGTPFKAETDKTLLGYLVNSTPEAKTALMQRFAAATITF